MANNSETSPQIDPKKVCGRYTMLSNSKWDEYLTKLGLGFFKRKAMSGSSSSLEISFDGNTFTESIIVFGFTVSKTILKTDEEFIGSLADGTKHNCKVTMEGCKLIQNYSIPDRNCKTEREFKEPDTVIIRLACDDVIAEQVYKKTS